MTVTDPIVDDARINGYTGCMEVHYEGVNNNPLTVKQLEEMAPGLVGLAGKYRGVPGFQITRTWIEREGAATRLMFDMQYEEGCA